MKRFIVYWALATSVWVACSSNQAADHHGEHAAGSTEHQSHEATGLKLVHYSDNYEIYIEASPLVVHEPANFLIHVTRLSDFKPFTGDRLKASWFLGGKQTEVDALAVSPGIYNVQVEAKEAGEGRLVVEPQHDRIDFPVTVFSDDHEPHHGEEEQAPATAVAFSKEQSWKVDFATGMPAYKAFGQSLNTTARVEALPAGSTTLTAKTGGVVQFISNGLVAGSSVSAGQQLFRITGSGMGNENASLVYQTASGDYELAKAEYERMDQLAAKQIVSQKEFLQAKNTFEKAKATYENLQTNFNATGQLIRATQAGVLESVSVKNGQHVSAGDPLARIAVYANVQLVAGVQPKYASALSKISSVTVHTANSGWTKLDELNGRLISVGRLAQENNYLIPVYFEAENPGSFLPGSFIEMNLTLASDKPEVVVPVSALLEQQGNFFVFVQIDPELFGKRQVFPGGSNGLETIILRGLSADERIVVKGAVLIKLASASSSVDPHAGHLH